MSSHDLTLFDIPLSDSTSGVEIHPSAVVHPSAQLGKGVSIGPFCLVGPKVILGDDVKLISHVTVDNRTTIGPRTVVYPFATIGVFPQDLKFKGEDGSLIIGDENSIRQYVNMSIGSEGGGGQTVVGRRNLFMVYAHVAHDCVVGDNIVFANNANLGGHVTVASHVVMGGLSAIHQYCRVGTRAMIAGGSMVVQDIPPYTTVQGDRAQPCGINLIGLKRAGYSTEKIRDVKNMYRLLYNDGLTINDCIDRIQAEISEGDEKQGFIEFLKSSERGVCR